MATVTDHTGAAWPEGLWVALLDAGGAVRGVGIVSHQCEYAAGIPCVAIDPDPDGILADLPDEDERWGYEADACLHTMGERTLREATNEEYQAHYRALRARIPEAVRAAQRAAREARARVAEEAEAALGYNPYRDEGYCQRCGASAAGNRCARCLALAQGRV